MKLVDETGNVVLLNREGKPKIVASIKQGKTYGSKNTKDMITPRLTVYTHDNLLEDVFIFYDRKSAPITHLQSKILNPVLMKIYLDFLTNKNDYSLDNLLSQIITDYFVNYLGYSLINSSQLSDELNAK